MVHCDGMAVYVLVGGGLVVVGWLLPLCTTGAGGGDGGVDTIHKHPRRHVAVRERGRGCATVSDSTRCRAVPKVTTARANPNLRLRIEGRHQQFSGAATQSSAATVMVLVVAVAVVRFSSMKAW
jgi:hypothetical protein